MMRTFLGLRAQSRMVMRMPIKANLTCNMARLRQELKNYPLLSPLSYGKTASYFSVHAKEAFVYHFSKDSIIFETYSPFSPVYSMRKSLLRLITMISFLGDVYQVHLQSLFPYIVFELSREEMANLSPKPADKNGACIILSKRIINLISKNDLLRAKNEELASSHRLLLARMAILEGQKGAISKSEFVKRHSLEKGLFESLSSIFPQLGYEIIYRDGDNFDLVRQ